MLFVMYILHILFQPKQDRTGLGRVGVVREAMIGVVREGRGK